MVSSSGPAIAGLAVGIAFIFIMSLTTGLSPEKTCQLSGQVDVEPFRLPRWVEANPEIVIGKIISVKSRVIDDSFTSSNLVNQDTGKPVEIEQITHYSFVTIQIERYLKDSTGSKSNEITFRDPVSASCYPYGERAIFFVGKAGDSPQLFWYSSMFVINETRGTVQSQYLEDHGEQPIRLIDFENKITDAIENQQSQH